MRCLLVGVLVLFVTAAHGAEVPPKATGSREGKQLTFPEKGLFAGVKATISLLESCSDESAYKAEDLKKAEQGDHVRLVFAKPVTVLVMRQKLEVSELVFRQPLNTGVFWVRTGEKWRRFSKYTFDKAREDAFEAWLDQGRPAK